MAGCETLPACQLAADQGCWSLKLRLFELAWSGCLQGLGLRTNAMQLPATASLPLGFLSRRSESWRRTGCHERRCHCQNHLQQDTWVNWRESCPNYMKASAVLFHGTIYDFQVADAEADHIVYCVLMSD